MIGTLIMLPVYATEDYDAKPRSPWKRGCRSLDANVAAIASKAAALIVRRVI